MSKKIKHSVRNDMNQRSASVSFDDVWQEWIVHFFKDGKGNKAEDYHTDDEQDALDTALYFCDAKGASVIQ
jgi:hypothetical protein